MTCARRLSCVSVARQKQMNLQDQYGGTMFDFSRGELDRAVAKLWTSLVVKPALYEAQQAVDMPHSLFYVKTADKSKAEHHVCKRASPSGLTDPSAPLAASPGNPELAMAKPKPAAVKLPEDFPACRGRRTRFDGQRLLVEG